jgi:hypothetical protein
MITTSQFLNSVDPILLSGQDAQDFTIEQTLTIPSAADPLIDASGTIQLQVNGPLTSLTEAEIAGVYPAPGSTDSPDTFLPHIALSRRTLPWERNGPTGTPPWLALLLLKDSELNPNQIFGASRLLHKGKVLESGVSPSIMQGRDPLGYARVRQSIADTAQVNLLFLRNDLLDAIGPAPGETPYLCNVKRVNDGGVYTYYAIVIGNRLPDAGSENSPPELHTAFLVSLENRTDFYDGARKQNPLSEIGLVVLHSWSFTPSKGGDFKEVMQAIHIRPNGGVLRFGNLTAEPAAGVPAPLSGGFDALLDEDGLLRDPLPHSQAGLVNYRGPLRPFPPAPRSSGFAVRSKPEEFADAAPGTPLDYSHAAAFELGRLLALASQDRMEDLQAVHGTYKIIQPELEYNRLPLILQKPNWVDDPWSLPGDGGIAQYVFKDDGALVGAHPGDVTGVNQQWLSFGPDVQTFLNGLEMPGAAVASPLDFNSVTAAELNQQFAIVAAKAQS